MKTETIDWIVDELKKSQDENEKLKDELKNLKNGIADVILDPVTHDANGNHLTGSQIKDQQLRAIADLIFSPKIRPMMGLFNDTADDLANLKIGFKS